MNMVRTRLIRALIVGALPLVAWAPLAANPAITRSIASTPTAVSGTVIGIPASFTVTSTKTAGGITFTNYTEDAKVVGDFQGTQVAVGVEALHADGTGVFNETDTFSGYILGRQGTCVLLVSGPVFSDGSFAGRSVIGHGTGELADIHGVDKLTPIDASSAGFSGQVQFGPGDAL
jgi:hypothetical protein